MRFFNLFLLSILLSSCGCKSSNSSNSRISINIEFEPQTLDPRKARSLEDINLVKTFMDGLMRIGQNGVTGPSIAEKYSVSLDRKSYAFSLRDARWSNGDPVRAQDFVYAWKKALSPDFHSDYAFLLYVIKNGKAIKQGSLPSSMLGVSAKDDYTLLVNLEYPAPFFLELLTLPIFFPVHASMDADSSDGYRNAASYICNGPFKMAEWKHNDEIRAVKNELYWDKEAVSLNTINMVMVSSDTALKMFQNKELDWTGSPYSSIPTDAIAFLKDQNLVQIDPLLGTYWIRTNTSSLPLQNENMRKALATAINRREIVEHVTQEYAPATGIVPTSMGLQETPYFADGSQEDAQKYLQVALTQAGLQEPPELTLMYVADSKNHRIAQVIQDQWQKALSLTIRLEAVEPKIGLDRISRGDYQLAVGSWIADFRDPINFLEVFKTKIASTNNTNWESLNYQKALESTYLAKDPTDRLEGLKKSEKILMEEMPVIPIFHYTMLHATNNRLKNVVLTDSGHIDFKWAYVNS